MTLYDCLLILKGIGEQALNRIQMQNIYNGNLLAMLVNLAPSRHRKTYSWIDFYQDVKAGEREMTDEEIRTRLHAMFGGKNGT